jgi:3-phenylpropionate/trans-cinnamate dioxygenase ferredoxin reductase subunit
MTYVDVLIVGTGHAGATAAIQLRQLGYAGSIALLGEEPFLPYERPPLSKDYLAGTRTAEDMLFRPASFWSERGIAPVPGERVEAIDPEARQVRCASGATFAYGDLLWTAGGRPRRLPGAHVIRSLADADTLRAGLPDARRILIVGGGYVGLEAAAVLSGLGKQVTLAEAADRLLARCAAEPLSRFLEAEHRARGVDIRLNTPGIDPGGFDLVVAGVGIEPNAEPLLAAGAEGGDGVLVDDHCRTTLPHIWAAGDCALHRNPFGPDRPIRIESVQNASDMAATVARALTGQPQPYRAVPWFWSNQYDLRLQTVGLSHDRDEALVRGDPATGRFAVIYRRRGRVIALDCVNNVRDYVQGRALVERGAELDAELLADPDVPLKSLLENRCQPSPSPLAMAAPGN